MENNKNYDPVTMPEHYCNGEIQAIDVCEQWASNEPFIFNALKYILRRKYKGNEIQDLKKAIWYINRHIEKHEKQTRNNYNPE